MGGGWRGVYERGGTWVKDGGVCVRGGCMGEGWRDVCERGGAWVKDGGCV